MSLKKYEAFVCTVQMGSLTKAAAALGSTQSRISHIISDLELEYGFTLMYRGRSGIRLTEAGALLLPLMENIVKKGHDLKELVAEIRNAEAGTLRIGTFTSVGVHWLPGMIHDFQVKHPKVELQMFSGDYHDMEQWFGDGTIDLGFVTLPAPNGTTAIPMAEDELVAVLPRGHRLTALEQIPITELDGEPLISLLETSSHDIHRALDKAGVCPTIRYTTKDDYAILAMVKQGLGISIVPSLLLRGRWDDLEIRPLSPRAHRTIALAIRSHDSVLPVVQAFADTASQWLIANSDIFSFPS